MDRIMREKPNLVETLKQSRPQIKTYTSPLTVPGERSSRTPATSFSSSSGASILLNVISGELSQLHIIKKSSYSINMSMEIAKEEQTSEIAKEEQKSEIAKEEQTSEIAKGQQSKQSKIERKKRKQSKIDEDDVVASLTKRRINGILLSAAKPSYNLKKEKGIRRNVRSLRSEHRKRLRYLLRQLVRRQNWDEAAGVLSLLLKGTHRYNSLLTNRTKYWATLKLLEHMGVNPKKFWGVYELWLKKDSEATKYNRSLKGRLDVLSQLIVFCLSRGDSTGAYDNVISLQQDSEFSKDANANLVAGLTFSHLWYNSVQELLCLQDSVEPSSPNEFGSSGPHELMLIDDFNEQSVVEAQDSGSCFQLDSNTSVRVDKVVDQDRKVRMREPKQEIVEFDEPVMKSYESESASRLVHTGDKVYGSIVFARDLEYMLMPIKFRRTNSLEEFLSLQKIIQNDHYKAAVKHLQNALHSTPPAFEALLPLIQMLLVGDQVKEAIEGVESVVQNSHASLPFRLKASLLEQFSKEDTNKLCICFEDTLKKDPTCNHSLAKLISLHHNGDYSIEKLIEIISLHLDATYANSDIWKEFASCFLKLSRCDEDRMSSCGNGYGDSCIKFSKEIPDMFQDDTSRNKWKLRSRWWRNRHFTQTILVSEVNSGNLELVVYKAASACHIYGSEFTYVVSAYRYLEKEKFQEMSILKMHMENAIGFTQHNISWATSDM